MLCCACLYPTPINPLQFTEKPFYSHFHFINNPFNDNHSKLKFLCSFYLFMNSFHTQLDFPYIHTPKRVVYKTMDYIYSTSAYTYIAAHTQYQIQENYVETHQKSFHVIIIYATHKKKLLFVAMLLFTRTSVCELITVLMIIVLYRK